VLLLPLHQPFSLLQVLPPHLLSSWQQLLHLASSLRLPQQQAPPPSFLRPLLPHLSFSFPPRLLSI